MLRKISAASLLFVLVASASALSFGSFSGIESKTVYSDTAEFSVSVFNMGENPVNLEINSEKVDGADLIHPDSMTIAPSKVTRTPGDDSEWFLLEDGRYVSVQNIPVEITTLSDTGRYDFDVSLSASSGSTGSGSSGAVQNIVQTRSYSFEAAFEEKPDQGGSFLPSDQESEQEDDGTAQQTQPSQTGSLQQSLPDVGNLGRSVEQVIQGEDQQQETDEDPSSIDRENRSNQDLETTGPESGDIGNSSNKTNQEGGNLTGNFLAGANQITILLFALMAGTMIYMVKVI